MPGIGQQFPMQFPMLTSGLNNTLPSQTAEQQLLQMFSQMQSQIQNAPPPQMEQVPNAPSPVQAFLAQLAGNVGSALAWNPQYSTQAERAIGEARDAKTGAEQRNLQRANVFDLKKEEALLDLAQKRVQAQMGKLTPADFEAKKKLLDYEAAIKRHQDDIAYIRTIEEIKQRSAAKMAEEANRTTEIKKRPKAAKGGGSGGRSTKGWTVEWRQMWNRDAKRDEAEWQKKIRKKVAEAPEKEKGAVKAKLEEDFKTAKYNQWKWYDDNNPNKTP